MKVLVIGGESANWVINWCNEICKKGNTITCVIQESDTYEKGIQLEEGLHVIPISQLHLQDILHEKFDIIFTSHVTTIELGQQLSKRLGILWVAMILDVPLDLIEKEPYRAQMWKTMVESLKDATTVIFNTYVARDAYTQISGVKYPDENVIVYGTNFLREYKNVGMNKDDGYILSICRLTPLKNCILIPRALSYINQPRRYVAIGRDGGQLDEIRNLCQENGITFEHYTEVTEKEKYEFIKNCSMLVYPQKTEYIGGLSPFEAMYVGKPTIVPYLKVLEDLYKEHSNYTINDDALQLSTSISILYNVQNDKLRTVLEKASDHAERTANYTQMAEGLIKILEKVKQ